jgi:hydroxypyruvate isomerase
MKPVICLEMLYPELTIPQKIREISQAGFPYLEFWDWKDKDIPLISSLSQRYNIRVVNFSGQRQGSLISSKTHHKVFSDLEEAIRVAKVLNCPYLMLLTDQLGEGGIVENSYPELTLQEKYHNTITSLKKAIDISPAYITLLVEILNTKVDHPGYYLDDIDTGIKIIREVNHSRLKILADLYHLAVMGFDLKEIIEKYLPDIGYFHIADLPGRHEPGTGIVDWCSILLLLKEKQFNGFVGFEYSPALDSYESLIKIKQLWNAVFPGFFD